jgi:glycosyltransferase involved in cell wall biosynthesis
MLLNIIIPTYNRSIYLEKNLALLSKYISQGNYNETVGIVVSNNLSTDGTGEMLESFKNENQDINVTTYNQETNLGLEKNALFVLEYSNSEYVMYLGDDDFMEYEYLESCVQYLEKDKKISCIIPSFSCIDSSGGFLPGGRDLNLPVKQYGAGYDNCLENSHRGHQLSGLVFRTKNLLGEYKSRGVANIYPFIFFVAYSCLNGKTVHLTSYPIKVTQVDQSKKDWGYGDDGLINEIFNNYIKLPISGLNKSLLQFYHLKRQSWRFRMYKKEGIKKLARALFLILMSKNSALGFRLVFPAYISLFYLKRIVNKVFHKL